MQTGCLLDIRRKLGLSQEELARLLNVGCAMVNRWEQGKPHGWLCIASMEFAENETLQPMSEKGEIYEN